MSSLTLIPNVPGAIPQELHDGFPFTIAQEGPTLPVVTYDEEYAESIDTEGARRVRSRPQNPEGSIPLLLIASDSIEMYAALDDLQQTVELCRRKGGTLTYAPADADEITYDLETIRLSELPQEEIHHQRTRPILEFTCRPYGRLTPLALVTNATSSLPIQSVSLPAIPGSAPAWVEVTVTDTATQTRDHLEVGLDTSWDGVAALLIDSASLSVSGLAGATVTRTGAYSGATNNVIRATIAQVAVGVAEATGLTHQERHRLKARIYASGTGPIYVRAATRIASGPWSRGGWTTAQLGVFSEVDLGTVKGTATGTLTFRIEAQTMTIGDTLDVDYLMLIPTAKHAEAKGRTDTTASALVSFDSFDQTAGNLDAPKTANLGGNWAEANRVGANGFQVEITGHTAQRTTLSDTSVTSGSFAYLSASLPGTKVEATVKFSAGGAALTLAVGRFGLLARYFDPSNWLMLVLEPLSGAEAFLSSLTIYKSTTLAGVTVLGQTRAGLLAAANFAHPLRLEVDATGYWRSYWSGYAHLSGYHADLATGGTLATGKVGLYDAWGGGTANTRNYDNFAASTPDLQHVTAASGAVIIDHNSIARSDGTRPSSFEGAYLTCPPAGRENRTHRLAVKMRRNDIDVLQDDQVADGQRVDVTVTPRVAIL